jgi:hypothetical protein
MGKRWTSMWASVGQACGQALDRHLAQTARMPQAGSFSKHRVLLFLIYVMKFFRVATTVGVPYNDKNIRPAFPYGKSRADTFYYYSLIL